jgi:hypothetical protein
MLPPVTPVLVPDMIRAIGFVPASRMPALEASAKRLARRAVKLGLPQIGLMSRPFLLDGAPAYQVAVVGRKPALAGWTFVCRVEHTAAGNLITGDGDPRWAELREQFRQSAPSCHHCGTRRARRDTFVLRHEDGRVAQIGRSCLQDYLGGDAAEVELLALFSAELEIHSALDEDAERRPPVGYGIQRLLSCAVATIRLEGYDRELTRSKACELAGPCPLTDAAAWRAAQPTEEDCAEAQAIVEWAIDAAKCPYASEYARNLAVAVQLPWAELRHVGLVVSGAQAYRRHLGIEAERAAERAARVSPTTPRPEVGSRVTVRAHVTRVTSWDTQYGTTWLVILRGHDGHTYTWRGSSPFAASLRQGDETAIKGTVRALSEWHGQPQVELTRCKPVK